MIGQGLHRVDEALSLIGERCAVDQGFCEIGQVGADLVLKATERPYAAQRPIRLGADIVFE
jgi:hypothetical protein